MIESGFFNGDTEYGQEEFNRYFANIFESGVSINNDGTPQYDVEAVNGQIRVGVGFAIVRGFYAYNNADVLADVAGTINTKRIDRVVLRLNLLSGPVELAIKEGSEEAAPELQRDSDVYEISLAKAVVYQDGNIEIIDERLDTSVCGQIRPRNLVEYQAFLNESRERFEKWFADQQSEGWRNVYIQRDRPTGAAEGSIWYKTE